MPGLDVARGLALLAMIVYHLAWNLSFLGLIEADIRGVRGWIWFARAIAASFLALAGIGLVLADEAGWNRIAYLRRLGMITGAALLVTAATYVVFPGNFVFFGILHAIALGSVLALPFLRMPPLLTIAVGVLVLLLPGFVRLEAFSSPWLIWLGLGTRIPVTNDFVPVLPWFAPVLFGVALAKIVDVKRFSGPAPTSALLRLFSRAGRHSLLVYLLHQPLLFGGLSLIALTLEPQPAPEARGFLSACYRQCRTAGGEAAVCTALCSCAMEGLKVEGLWAAALADTLDTAQKERVKAISLRCADPAAAVRALP